jgi:hypothetical protein
VNTSNAVFEDQGHAGNGGRFLKRRILTLRDPGAMEILPPQVPRTRERETTDPKPTMISPGKAIKPPIHLDGLSASRGIVSKGYNGCAGPDRLECSETARLPGKQVHMGRPHVGCLLLHVYRQ